MKINVREIVRVAAASITNSATDYPSAREFAEIQDLIWQSARLRLLPDEIETELRSIQFEDRFK